MSVEEAQLAIEQAVRNAQAGTTRAAVDLYYFDGRPVHRLLGIDLPCGTGLRRDVCSIKPAPDPEVLAPVNILAPAEGEVVTADRLTVRGLTLGTEGGLTCFVDRPDSVAQSSVSIDDGPYLLIPWRFRLDVPSLSPGSHRLSCHTDGETRFVDTRTIVVE